MRMRHTLFGLATGLANITTIASGAALAASAVTLPSAVPPLTVAPRAEKLPEAAKITLSDAYVAPVARKEATTSEPFEVAAAENHKASRPAIKSQDKSLDVKEADLPSPERFAIPPADGTKQPATEQAGAAVGESERKLPPSWPKTVEESKAEEAAKKLPPRSWTPEEVDAAKTRCAEILKQIDAVAIPESPIKEGACGAPAPIQLISIGRNPEVTLSPPATVTCQLAEALHRWLKSDLQPLAKKRLGGDIISIENMSSYSCRNAYGRAKNKLSEHGVANALDIRGFVTSNGKQAYVLEHWGPNNRDIASRIAAEQAVAAKLEAARRDADKAAQDRLTAGKAQQTAPPIAAGSDVGTPGSGTARNTVEDDAPKLTITLPGARPSPSGSKAGDEGFSMAPNKLGGPKRTDDATISYAKDRPRRKNESKDLKSEKDISIERSGTKNKAAPAIPSASVVLTASELTAVSTQRAQFLREAHNSACEIFGTTLGPDTNEAHRNHLHVDMAERKVKKICE